MLSLGEKIKIQRLQHFGLVLENLKKEDVPGTVLAEDSLLIDVSTITNIKIFR